jgi:signal transduction histidine kinase
MSLVERNHLYFTIKKHINHIILFSLGTAITYVLAFAYVFYEDTKSFERIMDQNVIEYQEVDREQLCHLIDCVRVYHNNESYTAYENHLRPHEEVCTVEFSPITGNLFHINNSIVLYHEMSESYYELSSAKYLVYSNLIKILVPLNIVLFLIHLYSSILREQEEAIVLLAGNEALLSNKSMISITENIHHELNTPLEVIDNKVEKIYRALDDYLVRAKEETPHREIDHKIKKLGKDFDFIKVSSEQIYNVLDKMKGFKQLRYSNGNKSIYDTVETAFKIISISNTDYDFFIDPDLKLYALRILKNADFLSIMINHIKNSLEASSSCIHITMNIHTEDYTFIDIIDNGIGIKIDPSLVFKPNFSTKSTEFGIRGNGMYLNKHILLASGGDINVNPIERGTHITLKLPSVIKKPTFAEIDPSLGY